MRLKIPTVAFASCSLLIVGGLCPTTGRGEALTPERWQTLVENHWLTDERVRANGIKTSTLSTRDDAAGGCDGIKDGQWGFHTGSAQKPWWQVDLGQAQTVTRVVLWNRCDAESAAQRATNVTIRLSADGNVWQTAYQHDGTLFLGFSDRKPLAVELPQLSARFVRIELPGDGYLHLDEVEVFGSESPGTNLALHKAADQVSTSQWSRSHRPSPAPDWRKRTGEVLAFCDELNALWPTGKASGQPPVDEQLSQLIKALKALPADESAQPLFLQARRMQRQLAFRNPLLDFDTLLFTKRVPASFNHMSDQYYGWWSKPGGGIFLLRNFKGGTPETECLTGSFTEPGSFIRPTLSYDGRKVLFAWCRYYPSLAAETNKLDKANVPEDAFYHLFEMDIDGSNARRLTRGKYDNFDGRYLPDGRIVFLSTRRGQSLQTGRESARRSVITPDLPDSYVRCGGGPERPVAVYTLHTMNADGSDLCAISPFEMFEWTPEIGHDGSIMYSRWDYVDRDNMPYMGLWAMNPDGSNARIIYGNFTKSPHCTFEAMPVPNSHKIVFTASAHHAQTMGSLVLLDPAADVEGEAPLTRLTPEVPFPEIEGWPLTSYASPWPLSERFHLVAWGNEGLTVPGPAGWDRWHAVQRPTNGMALYLFDAAGPFRELLYQDPEISCGEPIPVRARPVPPILASHVEPGPAKEGRFLLADVYQGLKGVEPGAITALRLVAVPAKTHPTMNFPLMGITADDPGKCVLGTVPVEEDGSAYFSAPAGVTLFFQALDARGIAIQSMRSATHVQPGQTVSCIGCHEPRTVAPPVKRAMASFRQPSRIQAGPEGSWPVHFGRLIQPVLDRQCVSCHSPGARDAEAAKFDLSEAGAYASLVGYGKPSLRDQVMAAYRQGYTVPGEGIAQRSALMALLDAPKGHYEVALTSEDRNRLYTWMDTYAQKLGAFSPEQEADLESLRLLWSASVEQR
ncbi:MAG: discoidin domain-containing protein [Verrucomicrobiia bacterium]